MTTLSAIAYMTIIFGLPITVFGIAYLLAECSKSG